MTIRYTYASPTTPGNPGWTVDLAAPATVRLGQLQGLIEEAELGAVGMSGLVVDDPAGNAGHNGDAFLGQKQFRVVELDAPSGNRRIWTGYTADRTYRRGGSGADSLRLGAARAIDLSIVDLNAFLSFRLLGVDTTSAFNRPAETDVARITALLAVDFLSTTLFDGLVGTTGPVTMDAVDYTGQRAVDVLNDCAQQSGKNFFVIYDEDGSLTGTAGQLALFYDYNDSDVYASSLRVSNVLADVDNSTTWAPFGDARLTRDPSRVIAGAFIPLNGSNGSNKKVYRTRPQTASNFGWRDAAAPTPNLNTVAAARSRADRYLSENATEDDKLTLRLHLPSAHVNDWKAGQRAQVKLSHLPGYEDFRDVRALRRSVAQDEETGDWYHVEYDCTPLKPSPAGAAARFVAGVSGSGIPTLPRVTTPGNTLIAVVATIRSNALPDDPGPPTFFNDPVPGSPPANPPYSTGLDGWTIAGSAHYYDSGMNIGPPGHVRLTIAYREVSPGEVTATPVAVGPGGHAQDTTGVWLWELPGIVVPTDPQLIQTFGSSGNATAFAAATGFVLGAFTIQQVDYGVSPGGATSNGTIVRAAALDNNDAGAQGGGWAVPYTVIASKDDGGALSATVTTGVTYNRWGLAGVAVVLPGVLALPDIPYPANQSA